MNQILHYSEHSDPSLDHLTSDMLEMRDVFLTIGVNDLRYYGSSHTWTNKIPKDPTTKKLDRALVNDQWLIKFPYSSTTFQAPKLSDHSSCLIMLATPLPTTGSKLYKFYNYLVRHPQFLSTIEAAWNLTDDPATDLAFLYPKLKVLKGDLKKLDKDFSDIQKRVSETYTIL